jgi:hypothetical protein
VDTPPTADPQRTPPSSSHVAPARLAPAPVSRPPVARRDRARCISRQFRAFFDAYRDMEGGKAQRKTEKALATFETSIEVR